MIEMIILSTKTPQFQSHNAYAKWYTWGRGNECIFVFCNF